MSLVGRRATLALALVAVATLAVSAVAEEGYTCDTCYQINMYTATCHWDTGGMIYGCYQTVQYDCNHHGWCVAPLVQSSQDLSPDGSLASAQFGSREGATGVRTRSVTDGTQEVACAGYIVARSYNTVARVALRNRTEQIAI